MLSTVGYESLDAFADDVVPSNIRIDEKIVSSQSGMLPFSESEMLRRATELSEDNEVFRSFIGMGMLPSTTSQTDASQTDCLFKSMQVITKPLYLLSSCASRSHGWVSCEHVLSY
jgi:hypothetical protein